jgi:hypothetical protein
MSETLLRARNTGSIMEDRKQKRFSGLGFLQDRVILGCYLFTKYIFNRLNHGESSSKALKPA